MANRDNASASRCPSSIALQWPVAALSAITLLGLGLRLTRLNFQPLWFDEGYSFYFAYSSIQDLIAGTAVDIHPPFYYFLLKGWLWLTGGGVSAARFLSVIIGTAAIPVLYALGSRLGDKRIGLLAAFFLAVSPFHIYYSQEVRMYGLVALLAIAAGLSTLRASETNNPRWWLAAGALITITLYTNYYGAFLPVALSVFLLLRFGLSSNLRPWLVTLTAAGLAYLPWLIYALPRLHMYIQYKVVQDADLPLSPFEFGRRFLVACGAGHLEGTLASWWALGLLPAAILLAALILIRLKGDNAARRSTPLRQTVSFSLIWLLVPLLGAFIVNLLAPFNPPRSERLLLQSAPAFYLLAACLSAELLASRRRIAAVTGSLIIASLVLAAGVSLTGFFTVPRYPENDYRPLARIIQERGLPTDAVVCVLPWQVGFLYAYLDEPRPAVVETPSQIYPQPAQFWAEDRARMEQDLQDLLTAYGRVWLPAYLAAGSPLEGSISNELDQAGTRALTRWSGNTLLTLHVSQREMTPVDISLNFGGLIEASHLALSKEAVASANGVVDVEGVWVKLAPFSSPYRIIYRLADDRGRTWQGWDLEPGHGRRPFSTWDVGEEQYERIGLLLDAGVPPGDYALFVGIRGEADAPLLVQDLETGIGRNEALLGPVRVERPGITPHPSAMPYEISVGASLNHQIRLEGYAAPDPPWTPGDIVIIRLFWHSLETLESDLVTFVQLLDSEGRPAALAEAPPTNGFFPTRIWEAGDMVRDEQRLRLPADLKEGRYRLIAGMFDAGTNAPLTVTAGPGKWERHIPIQIIEVRDRERTFDPPSPVYPASGRFGDLAHLVGYDMEVLQGPPGDTISITLHWKALSPSQSPYTVFVHLYDEAGRWLGQMDSAPGGGAFPTTGWLAGEYIADPHPIPLPADTARRAELLWIGFYDPDSGNRVPLLDHEGRVQGDHLQLRLDASR